MCGFISCLWSPVCFSPPRSVGLPLFLPCCPEGRRGGVLSSALILPICLQHRVTLTTPLRESLPLVPFLRPSLCTTSDLLLTLPCLYLACLLPDRGCAGRPWNVLPDSCIIPYLSRCGPGFGHPGQCFRRPDPESDPVLGALHV